MHRIDVQPVIDILPMYVRGDEASMTDEDRLFGEKEGSRCLKFSAEVQDFLELPATKGNGFSSFHAQPALQAIATWNEVVTRFPRSEYGDNRKPDVAALHQGVLERLGDLSYSLKEYAEQVGRGSNRSGASHFSQFAVKVDTFTKSLQ